MFEMKSGLEWTPDIDKPSDTPLEAAIKGVIKRMIRPLPADRISMAEVVSKFAELRSQYRENVESKGATVSRNIRPSQSAGKGFNNDSLL